MRVLLIGGSGQLGTALRAVFAPSNHVLSTACRQPRPGHVLLDLADAAAARALVDEWRPDLVLLAGAMCRVDHCEEDPELCVRINVSGPAAVAEAAAAHHARVVFFSTDHVFDGMQPLYREEDACHPLSVYARSKMEAEEAIRVAAPERHLIIRTGWVYGPDLQRRNFVLKLVDRLATGATTIAVPFDQWGSPTYTDDLAAAVRFLVGHGATGTFHATGPEFIDRVSLAHRVCEAFALDPSRVVPTPTSALGQMARRSLAVRLDCDKLRSTGAPQFRRIAAGLEALAGWATSTGRWRHA